MTRRNDLGALKSSLSLNKLYTKRSFIAREVRTLVVGALAQFYDIGSATFLCTSFEVNATQITQKIRHKHK